MNLPQPTPLDPNDTDVLTLTRGDGWAGTYALTAAFMLADLLSDGEPITATITTEDGGPATTVVVTAVEGSRVECADDACYDLSYVTSVIVH